MRGICVAWLLALAAGGTFFLLSNLIQTIPRLVRAKYKGQHKPDLFRMDPKAVKSSALRFVVGISLFLAIKAQWSSLYPIDGYAILNASDTEDVLKRKEYLVKRLATSDFDFRSAMPFYLSEVFKKEWAIGSFSMTSSALVQLSIDHPDQRESSLSQVDIMLGHMLSAEIRSYEVDYWNEDALQTLESSHGHAGYLGHLNMMLGARKFLGGDERYFDLHTKISDALARRILDSPHHFIETFPGNIFIPDNAAVVASVSLYDKIYGSKHLESINAWLKYTKENLIDSESGLLRPWISTSGQVFGPPRGSYVAWNVFYLSQIDRDFARIQFELYRKHLYRETAGFGGLREYMPQMSGQGDIDSGPVVFGISTSGTGFAVSGARLFNDAKMLQGLMRTAEFVGSSWDQASTRRYLLAPIVGDAIMLAMRTAREWDTRFVK